MTDHDADRLFARLDARMPAPPRNDGWTLNAALALSALVMMLAGVMG